MENLVFDIILIVCTDNFTNSITWSFESYFVFTKSVSRSSLLYSSFSWKTYLDSVLSCHCMGQNKRHVCSVQSQLVWRFLIKKTWNVKYGSWHPMFGHSAGGHNYPQMYFQWINDCTHPDFGHIHFCQLSGRIRCFFKFLCKQNLSHEIGRRTVNFNMYHI